MVPYLTLRARRALVLGSGSVAIGALLLSLTAGAAAAPPSGAGQLNVVVVNSPLPVSGTVAATQSGTWAVGATQSGTWNVGITGQPTVKSGDQTALLDSFVGSVPGGGAFTDEAGADTTSSKTVRVLTNCFAGGACANIRVRVYTVTAGARSYLLDDFAMQNFVATSNVYDVPGTRIEVQLINNNAGAIDNIGVAIFGRPN